MKLFFRLLLFLILALTIAGCVSSSPSMQPTQATQSPSPTILPTTATNIPNSTRTPVITDTVPATPTLTVTMTPLPTTTLTPIPTLVPAKVTKTLQFLLKDPLDCSVPCVWGIIPEKTNIDDVRGFFSHLGFTPFAGSDFYTIQIDQGGDPRDRHESHITFKFTDNLVDSIQLDPYIAKQTPGSPREWIAYSPETLIRKFGQPSRVMFQIGMGGTRNNIIMLMYFDTINLIVYYEGYGIISDTISPRLCPLTAPFEHVRLWIGSNPQYAPSDPTVPLDKATSLIIDQFSKLMLGDPQKACFTLKGDAFQ